MSDKIKTLSEIEDILDKHKKNKEKIVQCHGVFDLLHPGHIRHFNEAKKQGDRLVVTLTPDRFVNKGPGRPVFNQDLRVETIAALESVDYVVLNDQPDAVNAIKHVKPNVYVKGKEYQDSDKDVTGKIIDERIAVEKEGGEIYFTDDIVYSSSSLINQFIAPPSPEVLEFLNLLKSKYSSDEILNKINDLRTLKVLIIGDAILDEYQYVDLLGQSGKGHHFVASLKDSELFLGGSLIIANHVSNFCNNVTLVAGIGKNCPNLKFINERLNKNVHFCPIYFDKNNTLVKKRYIHREENFLSKLFETYSSNKSLLNNKSTNEVIEFLRSYSNNYDLVLVPDFANGFINSEIRSEISKIKTFTAINAQINSGNRGFNVITHYEKANFIALNEQELRLSAHDRRSEISEIVTRIKRKMSCDNMCITLGTRGVYCSSNDENGEVIPAFSQNSVDRVGAGDAFLALTAICLAKKNPLDLSAFIGSISAALKVQYVGNQKSINSIELSKYIVRMLK